VTDETPASDDDTRANLPLLIALVVGTLFFVAAAVWDISAHRNLADANRAEEQALSDLQRDREELDAARSSLEIMRPDFEAHRRRYDAQLAPAAQMVPLAEALADAQDAVTAEAQAMLDALARQDGAGYNAAAAAYRERDAELAALIEQFNAAAEAYNSAQ
jgi:hypothetical protein